MRRSLARTLLTAALAMSAPCILVAQAQAQLSSQSPQLRKLSVPASMARSMANKLSVHYKDVPGITISPDSQNEQLVVMAPEAAQAQIASDLRVLMQSSVQPASAIQQGPLQVRLLNISWGEFEDQMRGITAGSSSITTSRNGERAAFQLTSAPLSGTTVEVDRRTNSVTVIAPEPAINGWQEMINAIDTRRSNADDVMDVVRLDNADPAPIQRAIRLLREIESNSKGGFAASTVPSSPFRNAAFQAAAQQGGAAQGGGGQANDDGGDTDEEAGSGVAGDTEVQFIPELGMIIIKGAKKDVARVRQIIDEIEKQSVLTRPDVEIKRLQHADSNAVAALLQQLYEDVLSTRQGEVSITSLDNPNGLLLIGRKEAIASVIELIDKIDQPVEENDRLRVFRLQHASAIDAEETIRGFFTEQPGVGDDLRPGLGTRVRILADYRTNSLIVSASPRDLTEVTRLVNELDVQQITAQSEIRTFTLKNAIAEDLAETLNAVIAPSENDGEVTTPSTTLSIVKLGQSGSEQLDSGVLGGAVITADNNANAVVVKAPGASMPLLAELIRQLDQAPSIESLVKVFTLENSDAAQLNTALETLFGADAATTGTNIGAGNLAGLAPSTASQSALTPLRFSPDVRTNSIIASGSAEDLEIVESILLRLDSEGFAERITEVIWLRHQAADNIATALTNYVSQRSQGQNQIQQFQQGGLGPYDLPDRDLIVVAETFTNSLVISVAPRLYEDVRRLVDKLDRRPPMVMVKTVIAEVRLNDLFEIGGELGLQDSLLFNRDVAGGAAGNPPYAENGFNFNGSSLPNINGIDPNTVAARGVTAFGVGTVNSASGASGFVLNAASESVNLLFRTLQTAGRLQIISRPQITAVDNTTANVQVGQQVARPSEVVVTQLGQPTIGITEVSVGLILEVTARVGSDGLIYMNISAERSAINNTDPGQVIGSFDGVPVTVQPIDITRATSDLVAYDGQTVIFGGLIQKQREHTTARVPYLSSIPLVGNFFKFDRETEFRSELLLVMTPMLVDGTEDLEYIKQTESSRMSWCLADVVEAHGDVGLNHGYGLWGPAIGPTIYPDVTPTVDGMIIGQEVVEDCPVDASTGNGSVIRERVISDQPYNGNGVIVDPNANGMNFNSNGSSMIEPAPAMELPGGVTGGVQTPVLEPISYRSGQVSGSAASWRSPSKPASQSPSTPASKSNAQPIRLGGR